MVHGVVKREAEDLDEKVDRVAGQLALGPAPIAVFNEQSFVSGQLEVALGPFDDGQAALLQQRQDRSHAGSADLFTRPAGGGVTRGFREWGCHSLFSSGVE